MRLFNPALLALVPLIALGACTTKLNDEDRALLTQAGQNAAEAKATAQQALTAAQAAQASAAQAAADAKTAAERADRMFQHSQRKVTPTQ